MGGRPTTVTVGWWVKKISKLYARPLLGVFEVSVRCGIEKNILGGIDAN